tara:strand:+ start:5090 stop:5275 length:186 start_codon:yes stop_codon:yes gene_type:complete
MKSKLVFKTKFFIELLYNTVDLQTTLGALAETYPGKLLKLSGNGFKNAGGATLELVISYTH